MKQQQAEQSAALHQSQRRFEALSTAAEQLHGKHITVCRYESSTILQRIAAEQAC
jgi:hypothetical protein